MEFEFRIDIQLTEAAAAVAKQPSFRLPPQTQQTLLSVQMTDLVQLPPCTSTFVVLFRQWKLTGEGTTLQIVLDLPGEPPRLKAL